MKALRNYLDKIKPNFEEGGKLAMFRSVFEGFETFLFVPNETSKSGVHIHDSIDSKRTMTVVIIALLPALLFGNLPDAVLCCRYVRRRKQLLQQR